MRLRILLVCCAAVFLLAVAGGAGAVPSGGCVTTAGQTTCTFNYTGAAESWTVPVSSGERYRAEQVPAVFGHHGIPGWVGLLTANQSAHQASDTEGSYAGPKARSAQTNA